MAAARKLALGLPVDVNRISEEELSLVPGIGEIMAYKIIQLRRERGGFRDLTDLTALPGIKEKKLNSLKGYLIVRPVP
jgi:competence protein ComEA